MKWRPYDLSPHDSCPEARMGHTATLIDTEDVWGEKLLIIYGGLGADKRALDDLYVFQVQSQAWICPKVANKGPSARAFHCAAAVGRCLYVFGGHVYHKDRAVHKFADLWCLDTATWEWAEVSWDSSLPSPCARDFFALLALPGRLLLFAGLDSNDKKLDDTWEFFVEGQTWVEVKLAICPKPRHGHAMAIIGQQIFMCGGECVTGTSSRAYGYENLAFKPCMKEAFNSKQDHTEKEQLSKNCSCGSVNDFWILRGTIHPNEKEQQCWTQLDVAGEPFSPRKAHAVAGLGMQVLIFGGHTSESGWFSRRHEVYHNDLIVLERQGIVSWQRPLASGLGPSPREFHTLTAVSNDKLLLFGGGNGKSIFRDPSWLCISEAAGPVNTATIGPAQRKESTLSWPQEQTSPKELKEGCVETAPTRQPQPNPVRGQAKRRRQFPGRKHRRKFERLCEMLGAVDQLSVDRSEQDALAFKQLGRRQMKDRHAAALTDSEEQSLVTRLARQYLCSQDTAALTLGDIPALLWDYKQVSPGLDIAQTETISAAIDRLANTGRRRFLHCQVDSLVLGDLAALHAEYKHNLALQGM